MFLGLLIGLASAFLQSSAYIFSRRFVLKYNSPVLLMIYSPLVIGLLALPLCIWYHFHIGFPYSRVMAAWLALFAVAGSMGSFCFFRALKSIEASRLSSLMGLKIISLAAINMIAWHEIPSGRQLVAIVLCSVAAIGMNFTGGALGAKGCIYLFLALLCASGTDISANRMTMMMSGSSITLNAMAATSISYLALGAFSSLAFARLKFSGKYMIGAIPYAVLWFAAMIILFASFGLAGLMFGSIVQASRGVISVLLGAVLLKIGFDKLEPRVSGRAWTRRAIMAVLMVSSMALYVYGSR